ncbi:MAG: imidazolonepropionase [Desulfobacterales bacterium]|nr:imidazolonepropionase [Desulfobacterales bacterium]
MTANQAFDTLWINCHLATMAGSDPYGIVRNGALAARAGRIAWIGAMNELAGDPLSRSASVEDLGGAWITPGFIDCHTHLVYAGNRASEFELRLKGASYTEIARAGGGILSTVRAVRAATEDEIYAQSLPRLEAMMADGVTTLEIKSGYGLDTANEVKLLKVIRRLAEDTPLTILPTFLGAHTIPPEFKGRGDAYVQVVIEEMLPEIARRRLVSAVDGFCENIGFTLSQTRRILEAARAHGLSVKLHAEQLSDKKGAAMAASYRALSVDHLEYLATDDIPALVEGGCVAVLLPGAFYYLNETRKPPVDALRQAGVPMAVSTDANPGTSPVLSIRSMMNMACVLFGLTPAEALAGVTVNAARALGRQDDIGTLEIGKAADLAVWDVETPAELAYQLGGRPLRLLVKNGREVIASQSLRPGE